MPPATASATQASSSPQVPVWDGTRGSRTPSELQAQILLPRRQGRPTPSGFPRCLNRALKDEEEFCPRSRGERTFWGRSFHLRKGQKHETPCAGRREHRCMGRSPRRSELCTPSATFPPTVGWARNHQGKLVLPSFSLPEVTITTRTNSIS